MHYIGRNILGMGLNINQAAIGISSGLEIVFYCLTGVSLCLALGGKNFITLVSNYAGNNENTQRLVYVFILIFFIIFVLLIALKPKIVFKRLKKFFTKEIIFIFLIYFLVYSLIFFSGGIFFLSLIKLHQLNIGNPVFVISAYIFSSFIGTITPGAPGGIGVREAILIFILGREYPESIILQGLIIQRISLILCDLLVYPVFMFMLIVRKPLNRDIIKKG
jgi:hypothetical protein